MRTFSFTLAARHNFLDIFRIALYFYFSVHSARGYDRIANSHARYTHKIDAMQRKIVNPIIKDTVTFLETAEESGGKVSDFEVTLMPGGGNPLHYHKAYAETFTAIDGELGLRLGKKQIRILKPGESYTVETMSLHCFFNPTDHEIRFNTKLHPGHTGFEHSIRIVYGLASDGLTNKKSIPKSLKHAAIVLCMSDMNMPGLFTFIFPLLKRIAGKARKNGEEQRLVEKYCR